VEGGTDTLLLCRKGRINGRPARGVAFVVQAVTLVDHRAQGVQVRVH